MNQQDKLTEIFKDFPGIGERQARRFVYFLMSRNDSYIQNFIDTIRSLKKDVSQCRECFRFFLRSGSTSTCSICLNPNIDQSTIMILEKDSDFESVAKSRIYNGKYFLLGGLVPIVEKETKRKVRIEELKALLARHKDEIEEVILAFSISPQGNHTDFYVRTELADLAEENKFKISSLGRGLSTGTELEYSDNDTIKSALENRH